MPTNNDSDSEEAGKKRANSEVMESTLAQGRQIKLARSGSSGAVMAEGSSAGESRYLDSEASNSAVSDLSIRNTFSSGSIRPSPSEIAGAVLTDGFITLSEGNQQISEGVATSSLNPVQSGALGMVKEIVVQLPAITNRLTINGKPIDPNSERNEPDAKIEPSKVFYEGIKGSASGAAQGAVTGALVGSAASPIGAFVGILVGAAAGVAVSNTIDRVTDPNIVNKTSQATVRERVSGLPFPPAGSQAGDLKLEGTKKSHVEKYESEEETKDRGGRT